MTCVERLHLLVLDPGGPGAARRGEAPPGRAGSEAREVGARSPAGWWAAARGGRRPGTLPCLPSTSGRGCRLRRVRAVAGCAVRDSARPGEVGASASPARPRARFWGGVRGLAGTRCAFPFQIFPALPVEEAGRREEAGQGSLVGPSPPSPELRLFWKPLAPRPGARMLGRWEGDGGTPLPVWLLPDACPAVTRVAGRLGHHFACASVRSERSR